MTPFTHDVRMIRRAVHENGDVDGMCKHYITVKVIKHKNGNPLRKVSLLLPILHDVNGPSIVN